MNIMASDLDITNPKGKTGAGLTKAERDNFKRLQDELEFVDTFRHLNPQTVKYSYWNRMYGHRKKNHGYRLDYFIVSKQMIEAVHNSEIHN